MNITSISWLCQWYWIYYIHNKSASQIISLTRLHTWSIALPDTRIDDILKAYYILVAYYILLDWGQKMKVTERHIFKDYIIMLISHVHYYLMVDKLQKISGITNMYLYNFQPHTFLIGMYDSYYHYITTYVWARLVLTLLIVYILSMFVCMSE